MSGIILLNKNASDYDVLFEYSNNLINWGRGGDLLKVTVLDIDDNYKTMEVILNSDPMESGFIRWKPIPKY